MLFMEMTHNYKTRNYLMLNHMVLELQGLTKWWCAEIARNVDNGHAHNTITNSYQRSFLYIRSKYYFYETPCVCPIF
jgi:hypothetical protein